MGTTCTTCTRRALAPWSPHAVLSYPVVPLQKPHGAHYCKCSGLVLTPAGSKFGSSGWHPEANQWERSSTRPNWALLQVAVTFAKHVSQGSFVGRAKQPFSSPFTSSSATTAANTVPRNQPTFLDPLLLLAPLSQLEQNATGASNIVPHIISS